MCSAVVWMIDGNRWSDHQLAPWLACLSDAEHHRYGRFIRPMRQREFLIGRILLRFAVARLTNVAFDDIGVIERKNNGPLLTARAKLSAYPAISLSHSRGWVACATSADTMLGLDIEMRDASRDLTAVSRAAFSVDESDWLSRQAEAARITAFYALWSAKEALYKLMSNTGNLSVQPELIGDGAKLSSGASGASWHLKELAHPLLSIALCSVHPVTAPLFVELSDDSPFAWAQQADRIG